MQFVETREKTFQASAALAQYRRVRLTGGKLAYCSASHTDCIGVLSRPVLAADDYAAVVLRTAQGTVPMVASEAIDANVAVYAAANGMIQTVSAGTVLVGWSVEAASGSGSIIEVVPSAAAIYPSLARASLTQDDLKPYPIKIMDLALWDLPSTRAVATAANDDLAVIYGTHLTAAPVIQTGDVKGVSTLATRYIGFQFVLPAEYVDGQTATLRINAGMITTVADQTCTVDALVARQAAPTVDVCATAAQSINSLTAANKDFTITPTDCVAGDVLDVVLAIAYHDDATGTAVIGQINSIKFLLDVKG